MRMRSLVVGLLGGMGALPATADLPQTLQKLKPSILGIGTFAPLKQPRATFYGTGWVVADGRHAITNFHVVDRKLEQDKQEVHAVFVPNARGEPKAYQAEILACDKRHDLCVVHFKGVKLPPLKLGHASQVQEGRDYAMTGFPLGMVLGLHPVTHKGMVAAITPIAIPALSDRHLSQRMLSHLATPFQVFQLDAIAYPGNSGSPLYDPDTGAVVGVVNSVFVKGSKEAAISAPSGISYAIPVTHVYDLLLKARLKP